MCQNTGILHILICKRGHIAGEKLSNPICSKETLLVWWCPLFEWSIQKFWLARSIAVAVSPTMSWVQGALQTKLSPLLPLSIPPLLSTSFSTFILSTSNQPSVKRASFQAASLHTFQQGYFALFCWLLLSDLGSWEKLPKMTGDINLYSSQGGVRS